jgi:hypothetical protein
MVDNLLEDSATCSDVLVCFSLLHRLTIQFACGVFKPPPAFYRARKFLLLHLVTFGPKFEENKHYAIAMLPSFVNVLLCCVPTLCGYHEVNTFLRNWFIVPLF